ncbi:UDP-3-O-acyl-N-acetylglucosamine deacetylase [Niveispirillum cyanobacteriorum]|uniref:UDP-3-O-acyl-N-acetylglucosamine deacetylase n=1 Tax=Niveispirillum cyanobacteriorum TaxID=1612173 RepID=A0A2K9NAS4_9PROT|nr:UDP-3-O-acyl-N-acetylglucosamine deacetylase [Niveispirillum cyanobacteriorum]AUN30102.1 UDP-3-O-[3-hydroxymyristoyl] N-acetylglucosamine deacetylase [Niveispirillum cyanobacteriorum]GGE57979.1 UDP-3-O-acyl-N-acetylglucosamine deacetylase [Niveispirillum cyanobacteriorum]
MSWQQTLNTTIHCAGVGLHSGRRVRMTLRPAPVDHGISFIRTDVPADRAVIAARWDLVADTRLCTLLKNEQGTTIGTIEHLMAALRGLGIDNAVVEVDAPELPIMDGSSAPFVFLIECAGIKQQDQPRRLIRVLKEVRVQDGDKIVSLSPAPVSSFRAEIVYENTALIRRQEGFLRLTDGAFKAEVADCRTFGFAHEVEAMRKAGLGLGGSLDNAIVIDGDRVMNPGGLRHADEFIRHKILDAVGDLYLAGGPILGHYQGLRPGHAMNNAILRALFADTTAWRREDAETWDSRAAVA